jgi:DNA-binding transcriptional MocR family regulator
MAGKGEPVGDLVAQVVDHLRKEIVSGSFAAGMSLPSEGTISESLAVSRTVIREAMRSLSRPWPAHRLGRARPGPRRPGDFSGVARRAARDRHPQPLTAFHVTVRTAREKSGFKAGLRRRDKSGLERG